MSVSKNLAKTEFLKMKTSTSTRMGHVGEQNLRENGLFENENVGHVGEQKHEPIRVVIGAETMETLRNHTSR